MRFLRPFKIVLLGVLLSPLMAIDAFAAVFDHSRVGLEFEYEAVRPTSKLSDTKNHEALLTFVRNEFGGSRVRVTSWDKFINARGTMMAAFKDAQGRIWSAVPEKMNGEKFDGFELITPPLETPQDEEKLGRAVEAIRRSGLFKEGYSSSTHFTLDVSHWVGDLNAPGADRKNIAEFVDAILFLEMNVKSIFNLVGPQRYGHMVNKFAVPLALNQKDLLRDLAAMPRPERTLGNVRAVFQQYQATELALVGGNSVHAWKYRAFNYGKLFGLGEFRGWKLPVVEARVADLIEDSETLKQTGRVFARALAMGARSHQGEFRDPFPEFNSFHSDSESHQRLDESVRKESESRVQNFAMKLGLSPQVRSNTGPKSCRDLFLEAN